MVTAIVTVQEIKDYLQIKSNTEATTLANLSTLANSATAIIETYCGREFSSSNVVEIHNGGRTDIFVNRLPINNVAEVAEYDGTQYIPLVGPLNTSTGELQNTFVDTGNVTQYALNNDTGRITRNVGGNSGSPRLDLVYPLVFLNYVNGVKVSYNGGFDTIPPDLKQATLDYVKLIYKQEQGVETFSLQGESKVNRDLSADFPVHVRRILDLYRIW